VIQPFSKAWPQRAAPAVPRCELGEALDQVGRLRTGQAHVPVPTLAFLREQAAGDHEVQVSGRRRGGHAGLARQFGGGPRPAVEQRQAEAGAGPVG
jgi:hypothetical protein